MSEISKLKKENKKLKTLLKHSAALLERSTELLSARSIVPPKPGKKARKKAAKRK